MVPARVEDEPERDHPYRYFAQCTDCGEESKQATWEQALMASYGKHTGPKTAEGKKASLSNLDGHPTPEEALRTRFNAMKHGLRARVATYFPAKPGKYPHCASCHIDWDDCAAQVACMKRTELFMRHQIAFESKDPSLLTDIRSDLQANIQAIIDDIILSIASEGVAIRKPAYTVINNKIEIGKYVDANGEEQLIYDALEAHPLLKILSEFIARNSMSLGDMGMTAKVVEGNEIVMGNLSEQKEDRETLLGYQKQQTENMSNLLEMIERSKKKSKEDPYVIEHTNG
ncbi:MAG: hypothetical protein COA83_04585 [Methylophaga sp.]|nr:MAG: hypothetical protein COA83_04585 [Methylophaga sp.]